MKKSFSMLLLIILLNTNLFGFLSSDKAFIFPFSNKDETSQKDWLGITIAQLLEDDLSTLGKYDIKTVTELQNYENSAVKFENIQNLNIKSAKKFAANRSIDVFVVGKYSINAGSLFIELTFYKDQTEYKTTITTPIADMVSTISYEFYKFLKEREALDTQNLENFYANDPNSLITLQYHSKGLIELYDYMDATLNAKKSFDYANNGGKDEITRKMQEMRNSGTFNMAAIGKMLQEMKENTNVAALKMSTVLNKQNLYDGAFYFKEAIASDQGYGKNFAQLANILHATSKIARFNVPPKSYIKDLCKQAESSRVPAECKDDVYDYKEIQSGSDELCYDAENSFSNFTNLITNPTKAYNYSAYLDKAFEQVEHKAKCIEKKDMIETLALGESAMKEHYKSRNMKSYIRYEYKIASMYMEYEEWSKANKIYLKIVDSLDNYIPPKKKTSIRTQDEIAFFIEKKLNSQLKMQMNKVSGQPGSEVLSSHLEYDQKYRMKAYQKLATLHSNEGNITLTKKYLRLLENYSLKNLDEYVNVMKISEAYYKIGEYKMALVKANFVLADKMKGDMGMIGRQDLFFELYLYMASLYEKNGDYEKALKYADLASVKVQNLQSFIKPNSDEALKLVHKYNQRIENIQLNIYLKQNNAQVYSSLYAKIADKKAQKLYTQNTLHSMVNTRLNRSLKPILDSIKADRKKLLLLNESDNESSIAELNLQIATKQKELVSIEKINNIIDRKNALN